MKKLLLAFTLFALATTAFAADLKATAAKAQASGQPAVTVWISSTWGFRNQGAAKELNEAHVVFGAHGYEVVSVESYLENGDLQGFFVTYRRIQAPRP
jgi:opacity protein-like surface antigen